MAVIPIILQQHAEEAGTLWIRRDHAVEQPHFKLADLARLDEQLDAHLDGLRVAEADSPGSALNICRETLEAGGPGDVFPGAILAFESGNAASIEGVLEAGAQSYERSRALVSALGWLSYESVGKLIERLARAQNSTARRIGIAACAAHRRDPGDPLREAIGNADDALRFRAMRAVGELGRVDLLPLLRIALTSRNARCRFAAAWSIARFEAYDVALMELMQTAASGSGDSEAALQVLLRRMNPRAAQQWLKQLAADARQRRKNVIGAGILGLPESVPWLLDTMEIPEMARIAGQAFSMITGADIPHENLAGKPPEGFVAGPNDDPEDENVQMDPDENLPWPRREAVSDWWAKHEADFRCGTRYLAGQPVNNDKWLNEVLRFGFQRQRAAAALELAIQRPHQALFEIRAIGSRQQQLLGGG